MADVGGCRWMSANCSCFAPSSSRRRLAETKAPFSRAPNVALARDKSILRPSASPPASKQVGKPDGLGGKNSKLDTQRPAPLDAVGGLLSCSRPGCTNASANANANSRPAALAQRPNESGRATRLAAGGQIRPIWREVAASGPRNRLGATCARHSRRRRPPPSPFDY